MTTNPSLNAADPAALEHARKLVSEIGLGDEGIEVQDPASGEVIAHVPDAGTDAALAAVAEADEAGKSWARKTDRERANVLHEWWRLLVEHTEEIAHIMSLEAGKPLAESRAEIKYGSDYVRWFAEEAVRPRGGFRNATDGGARYLTRRDPVGTSVLITPWNFPLAMATRKIAPALAAGCAAVVKPATLTPLTTYYAVQLAYDAGVPRELLHVITTSDSAAFSEAVLTDPHVRKVSFTGSTGVGRTLLELASKNVLRSSMELGGNAPFIVLEDADIDRAVAGAVAAKVRNGGQSCIAANRYYVANSLADEFVERFATQIAQAKVGSGFGAGTVVGPLINERAVDNMERLTKDAVARGAEVRAGGQRLESPGNFFAPTVLDNVSPEADIANTEIFGPIAAIQRFDSEDDVLQRANDTEYGLAGYVFTENINRAFDFADQLQTGVVGINQGVPSNAHVPFGGVKASGMGREGGDEGIEEYQNIRFYNIADRPQ